VPPYFFLGGQLKISNLSPGKTGTFRRLTETREFYFVASSVRKSVGISMRQLRGPLDVP